MALSAVRVGLGDWVFACFNGSSSWAYVGAVAGVVVSTFVLAVEVGCLCNAFTQVEAVEVVGSVCVGGGRECVRLLARSLASQWDAQVFALGPKAGLLSAGGGERK